MCIDAVFHVLIITEDIQSVLKLNSGTVHVLLTIVTQNSKVKKQSYGQTWS